MTPSATLARISAVFFVLLVVSLGGPIAPMGIASVGCAVFTLAWLVATPAASRPRWPVTPVQLATFGWLAAFVIVGVFSLEPARSLARPNKFFMPLLVALAALHGADRRAGRRALAAYLGMGAATALWGLIAWWSHGHSYLWRARGLSHHYMTYGGQLQLVFPVACAVALLARSPRWRWGAALTVALTGAALAATYTRSSWLGAFGGAGVVLGFVWPAGVAALALIAAAAVAFTPGDFGDRLRHMFDPAHGYNGERILMWRAGVKMFLERPLTGFGLLDMHGLYDRYMVPGATEKVGHLHNAYVQIAATMGLTGLAAFGWLYTTLLRAAAPGVAFARRLRERSEDELAMALRLGAFAALAGFLVAACFEWNFGDEELLYHVYTLVGLAWAARGWSAQVDGVAAERADHAEPAR
ncbi:MAG: O-antigen ligase family protein [Candidatus Eisenbacteria bacterium]|uniref:O-antigen ligase family protein n=1 Tax=Eiseniibacteriota bacterium TaxID=2212470 RepID=A0A933SBI6_UNCEI|nr:O-antigen ligase family protein [Candidatus Eisenbacteria bacterium]